ncbi:MAG: hypothetical protein Q9218_005404 [Villophora microphyllina]
MSSRASQLSLVRPLSITTSNPDQSELGPFNGLAFQTDDEEDERWDVLFTAKHVPLQEKAMGKEE